MVATNLFSVSRAIRLAIGNEGNFDRNEVAEKVVSQIPESQYRDVLYELVLRQIPQAFNTDRNVATGLLKRTDLTYRAGDAQPEPQVFLDDDFRPPLRNEKFGAARRRMEEYYFGRVVNAGEFGDVRLGDLTVEMLDIVIQVRENQAKANLRVAEEFRALQREVAAQKVARVGDLDIKRVQEILIHLD